MFQLIVNDFAGKGFCSYRDENRNLARFQREGNKFTARLRFENGEAIVDPLVVDTDGNNENKGGELKVYPAIGRNLNDEEIQRPIKDFTTLVQHWYAMISAIKRMPKKGMADATVWREIMSMLSKYEELAPALNGIV